MFCLWQRRVGAIMMLALLLSIFVVPIASANDTIVHVVKGGETLTSIACLYGVTVQQIQEWNDISNPSHIYAGQALVINPPAGVPPAVPVANVDAVKFGGKTPDEWQAALDERYVRHDDPQTSGAERRYFKQVDKVLADGSLEPAVIEHNMGHYPLVQVYELQQLFAVEPTTPAGQEPPFQWDKVKFLVYYGTKRDPMAELLRTESSDWFYWGDSLSVWLDQVEVTPALSQNFDDLLNDFWGKMFDPGLEQDEFKSESFGHTPYVQRWIDDDKTVGDLVKGGQWEDIRVAVRPKLTQEAAVFHVGQNAVEIRVPRSMDLMVLLGE